MKLKLSVKIECPSRLIRIRFILYRSDNHLMPSHTVQRAELGSGHPRHHSR